MQEQNMGTGGREQEVNRTNRERQKQHRGGMVQPPSNPKVSGSCMLNLPVSLKRTEVIQHEQEKKNHCMEEFDQFVMYSEMRKASQVNVLEIVHTIHKRVF
jgi:hypothetical protein